MRFSKHSWPNINNNSVVYRLDTGHSGQVGFESSPNPEDLLSTLSWVLSNQLTWSAL